MTIRLRPHQQEAVDAAVSQLQCGTAASPAAATVVMATGAGKTYVAWETARRLGARFTVVAAPTRSLVDQLAAEAKRHNLGNVAVVSSASSHQLTGVQELSRLCDDRDGKHLIVTTYASLAVVAQQLRQAGRAACLLVADEAHHTAGRSASLAAAAHTFPACRRLYMTATPRVYGRVREDLDITSMDDTEVFGPRVADLDLAQAIEAGIVADYRVVIAVVDAATLRSLRRSAPETDPSLVSGAVALLRTMREYDVRAVLSYHSRIARARNFAALVSAVASELNSDERPSGPGFAAWVSGSTAAHQRSAALSRLASAGDGWALVANARCLNEGVDVPRVDGIAICDPKTSNVDVAQAVGRALRPSAGKVATIVLPVLADGDEIDVSSRSVAGSVLRVLRGHDRRLGLSFDRARRQLGREARVPELAFTVTIAVPPGVPRTVVDRLRIELVREASPAFDEMFGLLEHWVQTHGHAAVPQSHIATRADGTPAALGHWVTTQRQMYRSGRLALEREAALEALPGWVWQPLEDRFTKQLSALRMYVDDHGGLPNLKAVFSGVKIGQFVNVVRTAYASGSLAEDKVRALEEIPGWTWDVREASWRRMFERLREFSAVAGHARPSSADQPALGRWVSKQRVAWKAGSLSRMRVAELESLPGWVWHERDAAWEAGLEAFLSWSAEHPGQLPTQDVEHHGVRVGGWVAKQRSRFAAGRLEKNREVRLTSVPGWEWSPLDSVFENRIQELVAFREEHGHCLVPDDGSALGSFVYQMRLRHRRGLLQSDRVLRLEQFDGWEWDGRTARRRRSQLHVQKVERRHLAGRT